MGKPRRSKSFHQNIFHQGRNNQNNNTKRTKSLKQFPQNEYPKKRRSKTMIHSDHNGDIKLILPMQTITSPLIQFLHDNGLQDIKHSLQSNHIEFKHLLSVDTNDLNDLCQDLQLSTSQKIRFKHAIKTLQYNPISPLSPHNLLTLNSVASEPYSVHMNHGHIQQHSAQQVHFQAHSPQRHGLSQSIES